VAIRVASADGFDWDVRSDGGRKMREPDGLLDRLRTGCPNVTDLAFVEYRLSIAVDHSEIKVLRRLRARIVGTSKHGNGIRHD
jgi:hypothetical protein